MSDTLLKQTQQETQPGKLVILFILDLTDLGGSILRFTSTANGATSIVFDGNTYVPIEVEATGFDWNSEGAFPQPTLKISNVEFSTRAAVQGFGDLVGGKLTRIRTFRKFLDDSLLF